MILAETKVNDYLEVLNSKAPAPGGGAVCALTAAQGAALIGMVADLTLGKAKYAEYETLCREAKSEADRLVKELLKAADDDASAFMEVSRAYSMAKDTEEEKEARGKAIAESSILAAKVPFDTMKLCLEGLKLTESLLGKSNQGAVSDLGVAALNFEAAIKSAWLNVKINLASIRDEGVKMDFVAAKNIAADAEKLAKNIYDRVEDVL